MFAAQEVLRSSGNGAVGVIVVFEALVAVIQQFAIQRHNAQGAAVRHDVIERLPAPLVDNMLPTVIDGQPLRVANETGRVIHTLAPGIKKKAADPHHQPQWQP